MIRWLISALLYLAANALGLWVADLVLDDMSLTGSAFITAVFSSPWSRSLFRRCSRKYVERLRRPARECCPGDHLHGLLVTSPWSTRD